MQGERVEKAKTVTSINSNLLKNTNLQTNLIPKIVNRRRSRSSDTDDEEDEIDSSIDDKLNECAQRNNLTPQNVKNILQVCHLH